MPNPTKEQIELAVNQIIIDLRGRGGLGNIWEEIHDETRAEIRDTWIWIVEMAMA